MKNGNVDFNASLNREFNFNQSFNLFIRCSPVNRSCTVPFFFLFKLYSRTSIFRHSLNRPYAMNRALRVIRPKSDNTA